MNLGTSVYQNPIKDVEYCVKTIMDNKKIPETEVFELGMINTVRELNDKFHFVKPILFALVFGHGGEMPATVPALRHMIQALEENFQTATTCGATRRPTARTGKWSRLRWIWALPPCASALRIRT